MKKNIRLSKDSIITIDENCIGATIFTSEIDGNMTLAVYDRDLYRNDYDLKTKCPIETFNIFEKFRESFRLIHDSMYIYDSRESIILMNDLIESLKIQGNILIINDSLFFVLNSKYILTEFDTISDIYSLYLESVNNNG